MRASGAIRVALAFAALLASLSLVVYRQSRALDVLHDLDGLRSARAVAESERAVLSAKAQELESRARIKAVAEARWGMRVPVSGELVTLLAPARVQEARVASAEVR